ncbi:hypothetical protein [Streptomyces sp. NRRL S-1022]|uniref:hypothetical protein n=1 Tax=Streptomyces sp. NRRL S-1022 TaxID=1463880 RepID=UPI00131DDDEC|nr:hypothetical protein [Streptomyces sp. NRRL S-1022]
MGPPPRTRRVTPGERTCGGGGAAGLPDADEAHWLQEKARGVRQGFMDPKQRAASGEFLARHASRDEQ